VGDAERSGGSGVSPVEAAQETNWLADRHSISRILKSNIILPLDTFCLDIDVLLQ
jgi:hypothetical protein